MQKIIIIPCYNEANRLPAHDFVEFAINNQEILFLFVNDGSTDNTLEVINSLASQNDCFLSLDLDKNGGKAEAVRQGMLYAANNFESEYIGFWDADLATPLNEIPRFIESAQLNHFHIVSGLRLMRLGAKVKRLRSRHYLGRFFATAASLVLKLPVYDTQCGAKLYQTDVVNSLFKDPFITRWLFDVELLARYIQLFGKEKAKNNIYECPLFQWEDIKGSSLKFKDFFKAPFELIKIRQKYLKHLK